MKIFSHLAAVACDLTLRDGCQAIAQLANDRQLIGAPWSLAELGADDDDLCWLFDWTHNLDAMSVRRWQKSPSHRAALGSLLLLFAAEYNRRALPRSGNSSVPPSIFFAATARAELFHGETPSPEHQQALIEASQRLRLRYISDCKNFGEQSELIAAQIGFTEADIHRRLPGWLMGAEKPAAVNALLDSQTGSQTFQFFWQSCRAFQTGQLSPEILRQRLTANPWCLSQWIEPLISVLRPRHQPPTLNSNSNFRSPGDLFAVCEPDEGHPTIADALRALDTRADQLKLGSKPWSLAELRATDYDYIWLRVWVKKVDADTVRECLSETNSVHTSAGHVKSEEAIGCLLLLWMAETARREAIEGELWPSVADGYFAADVQSLFFTQGQPTQLLRAMLRAAAVRFNLRHALGENGGMRWVNTVFRQFGFTRRGFRQRLPEWLVGQAPQTVQALLDARQGSDSFRQLWQDLQTYGLGQISADQLRPKLEASAWLLPEWIDDILALASASPILPTTPAVTTQPSDSFITQPLLRWHEGGSPYFLCQLATNFSDSKLTDDCYDVHIGGQIKERLLRQTDGSYSAAQFNFIALSFAQPTATASLINPKGETVASRDLEFWPPDEDVVIYRLPSGERLDPFADALNANANYALLTAADLTVEPEPGEWQLSDSGLVRIHRLRPGLAPEMRVTLDGELLWKPNSRRVLSAPTWADQVDVFLIEQRPVKWGKRFQIKIIYPPDVTIRYARCRGRALTLAQQNEVTATSEQLTVTPEFDANKLVFRIGLQKNDQRCSLQRTLQLKVIGAARLTAAGWQPINKHSRLTVEQAKRDLFKLAIPTNWGTQALNANNLFLFEGDNTSHQKPVSLGALGNLTGWGAPLRVRQLFNFAPGRPSLSLAATVVNHGVLEEAVCESLPDGTAQLLRLRFRERIEPSERHSVHWWSASGELIKLVPKCHDEAEGGWWWVCDLPESCGEMLAVAVAYAGERLGAWWPENSWLQTLPELFSKNTKRTAALLRWFHLPLLSREALSVLRPLIAEQPIPFLKAWLRNEGLPEELTFPPSSVRQRDEVWLGVVRTLFHEWQPNAETARLALLTMAEVDDDDDLIEYLPDAAKRLIEVDPLLLAKTLKAWSHPKRAQAIQRVRLQLAQCNTVPEITRLRPHLIEEVSAGLNVNKGLVEGKPNGLLASAVSALRQNTLLEVQENNLALAVRQPKARLLLALHLLENI